MEYSLDDVKKCVLDLMREWSEKRPNVSLAAPHIANLAHQNYGYKRELVEQAVIYLYDDGWLKREKSDGIPRYRLSSKGHQEFIATRYKKSSLSSTIINNQTGGISIFGSSNSFGQVTQATINNINNVDEIIKLINSINMEENRKRDTILDAETLKNELAKSKPDQAILTRAWNAIVENAKLVNNSALVLKALSILYPTIKSFVPTLPELPNI